MTLFFITGNTGKFSEVKSLIPNVEQMNLDLPELQSLDPHVVIKGKLMAAKRIHQGHFIVEDTSLFIAGMGGLPGTFIKWFLQALGPEALAKMAIATDNTHAVAKTCIGYLGDSVPVFFDGSVTGNIVMPRGSGFGWDSIFLPDGHSKTFGEMSLDEKNKISMRMQAVEQMRLFFKE